MKERIAAFLRSTFSEADGTASATRVLAGSTVAATLVWISFIVFTHGQLPDLGGASLFLSAGFSGYSVNKISRAFGKDEHHDDHKDGQ